MDIRQLQYFITVAECLSFTEASKRLYVAQSALSQQIVEMEKRLGVTLLHRSKRSVKLTNAGIIFLRDSVDIVSRYEQALERVRQTQQGLIGSLRIGVLTDSFTSSLPPLIQKFISSYPNIELKLEALNNGPLMEKLTDDDIDVAFTLNLGIHYIPEVDSLEVGKDYISVILHKNHPLASDDMVNLGMLSNENFIIVDRHDSPQGYDKTIQICADNGFPPKITSQVHAIKDILFLVESGLGVAIIPNYIAENYSENLICIPINRGKYVVDLVAAWKKTNSNPSLPYFMDALRTYINDFKEE
jgi:DNA-binding transcriptional LysR family regulator